MSDTAHLEQDPAIYLRQHPPPTSPCHLLVEQLESHNGDYVPMHMLAKVAVRLHQLAGWGARFESWWLRGKRLAAAVAASALASLGGAYKSCEHAHDARIVADARSEAADQAFKEYRAGVTRDLDRIEREITDIRRALLRLGVAVPAPQHQGPDGDSRDIYPDKYSELKGPSCTFASRFPYP